MHPPNPTSSRSTFLLNTAQPCWPPSWDTKFLPSSELSSSWLLPLLRTPFFLLFAQLTPAHPTNLSSHISSQGEPSHLPDSAPSPISLSTSYFCHPTLFIPSLQLLCSDIIYTLVYLCIWFPPQKNVSSMKPENLSTTSIHHFLPGALNNNNWANSWSPTNEAQMTSRVN